MPKDPSAQGDAQETASMEGPLVRAYQPPVRLRIALISSHGGTQVTRLLSPDTPLIVGRAPAAGLRIDDPTLSREHARFLLSGSRVLVEDLGSKNGTFFAGSRVSRVELTIGDEVVLGSVALQVQALGAKGDSLGLVREELIRHRLEEELTRARQFRRPFALLLVRVLTPRRCRHARAGRWRLDRGRARSPPPGRCPVALRRQRARGVAAGDGRGGGPSHRPGHHGPTRWRGQPSCSWALPSTRLPAAPRTRCSRPLARPPTEPRPRHPVESGPAALPATGEGPEGAIIAGQAMRPVLETVASVATSRIPVILHGETGTGKEVLAQLIHESGPRKGRRIVRVNCGAIPKDLVESTLFGHERGAFTGALQQQKGVFEEADGGTVFLDEIGELPPRRKPRCCACSRWVPSTVWARTVRSRSTCASWRRRTATSRPWRRRARSGPISITGSAAWSSRSRRYVSAGTRSSRWRGGSCTRPTRPMAAESRASLRRRSRSSKPTRGPATCVSCAM